LKLSDIITTSKIYFDFFCFQKRKTEPLSAAVLKGPKSRTIKSFVFSLKSVLIVGFLGTNAGGGVGGVGGANTVPVPVHFAKGRFMFDGDFSSL